MHSLVEISFLLALEVMIKLELMVQPCRSFDFGEISVAKFVGHENQKFVMKTGEHSTFVFVINNIGKSQIFKMNYPLAFVFKLNF